MSGIFTRVAELDGGPGAVARELGRQAGQAVGKGFGDAGRLIVRGVEAVKRTPHVRSVTEPVGAAVGAAGAAIGAAVGAVGTPIANAIEGKPLMEGLAQSVRRTAKDTASFGYRTGKEGAFAALTSQFGGSVANAGMAASGIGTGVEKLTQGDYAGAGLDLGTAAVGVKGALSSPTSLPFGLEGAMGYQKGAFPVVGSGTIASTGAKGYDGAGVKFSAPWDDRPRFEIDDSAARLSPSALKDMSSGRVSEIPLKLVLKHKELFDNYPQLKDVKVKVGKLEGAYAMTAPDGTITIDPDSLADPREAMVSLMHEVQHNVQRVEGLARGTSTAAQLKASPSAKALADERFNISFRKDVLKSQLAEGSVSPADFDAKMAAYSAREEAIAKALDAEDEAAMAAYRRAPGEVEARAVEKRIGMSKEERALKLPYEGAEWKDPATSGGASERVVAPTETFKVPGVGKRVHVEDARRMVEFIDGVRLKRIMPPELERDASRLARFFGISAKTPTGIANGFEKFAKAYYRQVVQPAM